MIRRKTLASPAGSGRELSAIDPGDMGHSQQGDGQSELCMHPAVFEKLGVDEEHAFQVPSATSAAGSVM